MFWRELPYFLIGVWALAFGLAPRREMIDLTPGVQSRQDSAEILSFPKKISPRRKKAVKRQARRIRGAS